MGELQDKARDQYGITNADEMSEAQLKAEMKTIDDQPKSADGYQAPKKAAPAKASKSAAEGDEKPAKSASEGRRRGILRRTAK